MTTTDLLRIVNSQQPLYSSSPNQDDRYSEGHVHLNGVYFDGVVILNQLVEERGLEQFNSLTKLSHGLLREIPIIANPSFSKKEIDTKLLNLWKTTIGVNSKTTPIFKYNFKYISEQNVDSSTINSIWLRKQIACAVVDNDLTKAWLWFIVWLWREYQNSETNTQIRMAIFLLMITLMNKRSEIIMDGQGLTRFVETNNHPLRKSVDFKFKSISSAKKILQGRSDVAEIKVTHHEFSAKNVISWINSINKTQNIHQENFLKRPSLEYALSQRKQLERWHFCINFIRNNPNTRQRQNIWKEGKELKRKMESKAGWKVIEDISMSSEESINFNPSNWIRGLDVAGDENTVKTEIYAPVIRWLRNVPINGSQLRSIIHDFHLSIHAGEDYAHPASGMRNIDETVTFCEMTSGDRLGHALALGIEPKHWIERQGDIFLPVEEHLDNIVWLWHFASNLRDRLSLAEQVLPDLERRIAIFSKYVPWTSSAYMRQFYKSNFNAEIFSEDDIVNIAEIEPQTFYEAWLLRRNCFFQLDSYTSQITDDSIVSSALPDIEELVQFDWRNKRNGMDEDMCAKRLYCQRAELMRSKTKNSKGLIVHVRSIQRGSIFESDINHINAIGMLEDFESSDDIEFLYALQDYLLNEYKNKGLIIEVNPSSNVYISKLTSYTEHPIFRWNPPDPNKLVDGNCHNKFGLRDGLIDVTINTDDPGIMPTTLRTEYKLLYKAAIDNGFTVEDAGNWINRICQFSNQQFDRVHKSVFYH
ncbi:hypothetical protein AB733_23895 [Photobacterium swingsii]|uniref:antiviral RADAR system adenosine deaminase RdrB n=1 Tax=Photobacterium swingsii TaxID=680026 RepID=UPI0006628EE6|nr:antiviral RADAR system adenosine deaminase RdrB [Photobacterium swingsii]KMV28403.1 hypothetical protein AB733_23895 [Photobacterium swingsii]